MPAQKKGFADLPAELRLRIYGLLEWSKTVQIEASDRNANNGSHCWIFRRVSYPGNDRNRQDQGTSSVAALARVSKEIGQEVVDEFFRHARFTITAPLKTRHNQKIFEATKVYSACLSNSALSSMRTVSLSDDDSRLHIPKDNEQDGLPEWLVRREPVLLYLTAKLLIDGNQTIEGVRWSIRGGNVWREKLQKKHGEKVNSLMVDATNKIIKGKRLGEMALANALDFMQKMKEAKVLFDGEVLQVMERAPHKLGRIRASGFDHYPVR